MNTVQTLIYHVSVSTVKPPALPDHIEVHADAPLAEYTTFRIGGPADLLVIPHTVAQLEEVLNSLHHTAAPRPLILGGGANVLVADEGIRGVVIVTTHLNELAIDGDVAEIEAGKSVSEAAWELGDSGRGGLHFLYGMPGTVGGAVWMNARCYGGEISEILESVRLLDYDGERVAYRWNAADFSYKRSPFQTMDAIIISARFRLFHDEPERLREKMVSYRDDRRTKGHFAAPSAGSMFKNDRSFGAPSGRIIDEAGLRGYRIGDAAVSAEHGNIFVNAGNATAREMAQLVRYVQERVHERTGFRLAPEVQFIGDWRTTTDADQH